MAAGERSVGSTAADTQEVIGLRGTETESQAGSASVLSIGWLPKTMQCFLVVQPYNARSFEDIFKVCYDSEHPHLLNDLFIC